MALPGYGGTNVWSGDFGLQDPQEIGGGDTAAADAWAAWQPQQQQQQQQQQQYPQQPQQQPQQLHHQSIQGITMMQGDTVMRFPGQQVDSWQSVAQPPAGMVGTPQCTGTVAAGAAYQAAVPQSYQGSTGAFGGSMPQVQPQYGGCAAPPAPSPGGPTNGFGGSVQQFQPQNGGPAGAPGTFSAQSLGGSMGGFGCGSQPFQNHQGAGDGLRPSSTSPPAQFLTPAAPGWKSNRRPK
eukprot:Hpha_TRINITY_DN15410_c3_g7::TRINITY_DN15410_c3_g7_i1::g.173515::m.173515